jgi:hypothetical protein
MKKIIISIFISGIVFFCNAQTKAEENNSNSRQTEVVPSVDGAEKHSKETKDKQISTTVRTDIQDAIPVQTEKSKNNRTSKNNPANRKREEN